MGILRRLIGTAFAAGILWIPAVAGAACASDVVDLRGDWGTARFRVELALDAESQARGLMFREEMASSAGMLFVYQREKPVAFWMRNTLLPLDMIFLDDAGIVTKVHSDAVPGDETAIPSDGPARAVLEVNAGTAARLGIAPGDQLRSPILPQDEAGWACE